MLTLNTLIGRSDGAAPWSHVVVVGAGDGQRAAAWSSVPALRRDLIEADPQRATLLQRSHGTQPSTQIWPEVVALASGPVTWHRYQPDFLDGVFDARDLRDVFPRLQCQDRQDVDGIGLGDLLARLGVRADAPDDRLLILDVPGARRLLTASAPHPALRGCGRVVLRDLLDPLDDVADDIDVPLAGLGFTVEPVAEGWRSYRRDADRMARLELEQALLSARGRCASLEQQLEQQERDLLDLRATQDRLGREAEQALERAQAAEAAADDIRRALTEDLAAARQSAAALQAQVDRLSADLQARTAEQERLAAQERQAVALLAERDAALASVRAEGERAARDAAAREAGLKAECASHAARAAAAEAAGIAAEDDQKALQARCTVATERTQQIERKLAETEATVQTLQRDKQTLTTERDTAQKALQDKTRRVQVLEAETADLRARLDLMTQEIGRAEGQLDVLKELFVQETAL